MKENNRILNISISIMIWIVMILATYLIVDTKTKQVADDVISQTLALEYDKVWWKENYDKIISITREQTIAGLKQYDANWADQATPSPQVNTDTNTSWTSITLDEVSKITWENTYILWNPDAEISWVEYSDLECPFCKKLHTSWTIDEVLEAYDWKVNFIFKQFPLNFHQNAPKESEASLCAWELGWREKYYAYINAIFERTTWNWRWFALDKLTPLAVELWLPEKEFQSCLDSWKYASQVNSEISEWQGFGITWTPWNVLINNKTGKWDTLPWAYPTASFKQKIDSLLQ